MRFQMSLRVLMLLLSATLCLLVDVSLAARVAAATTSQQQQLHQQTQQQQQQQQQLLSSASLFQSPAALAAQQAAPHAHLANRMDAPLSVADTATLKQLAVAQSPLLSQSTPPSTNTNSNQAQLIAQTINELNLNSNLNSNSQQQQPAATATSSSSTNNALNAIDAQAATSVEQDCATSGGFVSFELITGYVLSAPAEAMVMQPGTLQLTDCLNLCRANASCLAINFETGLCVLLAESADKNPHSLQKSQFPVFTIYAHKVCLQGDRNNRCHKSWAFERVVGWTLNNYEKKTMLTKTRLECLQACYSESTFSCKSFTYDSASGSCLLSDVDRHSLPTNAVRRRHYVESHVDSLDYGENNCAPEVRGICDFKQTQNKILKTVDSIYQDVKTDAECRKRCLSSAYRCHSYDLGDPTNPVCRTSHLNKNSLQQIQDPYLEIRGAQSYELDSCYNVTVSCRAREMVARVRTNKLFSGKIYAKSSPMSCVNDVSNSLEFELPMAFNDACGIQRSGGAGNNDNNPTTISNSNNNNKSASNTTTSLAAPNSGIFSNEVILQHNDMIVTNADIGLNVRCQYDLRNQTVYNNINLDDFLAGREPIDIASHSATIKSPNISMQIMRVDGNFAQQAQVGDPLLLRFNILDERSPFEIFVRDLYAMDGIGGSEIMLIDSDGCPTDPSIMAAMAAVKGNAQSLEAQFDAFKFPTSETVAFRALVTPCVPHCEPVHCQNKIYDGSLYDAESFGRRRRRRSIEGPVNAQARALSPPASSVATRQAPEVLVRNSIEITDKLFGDESVNKQHHSSSSSSSSSGLTTNSFEANNRRIDDELTPLVNVKSSQRVNAAVVAVLAALLACQTVLLVGGLMLWQRRFALTSTKSVSAKQLPAVGLNARIC